MKLHYSRNPNPRLAVAVARHLGSPVEFVFAAPFAPGQAERYRPLNPSLSIPILEEAGRRSLWEADAIACRLSRLSDTGFWRTDDEEPDMIRWLSWGKANFVQSCDQVHFEYGTKQRYGIGPVDRIRVAEGLNGFRRHAAVLEAELATRDFLLESGLSYADFRMASFLPFNDVAGLPLTIIRLLRPGMAGSRRFPVGPIPSRGSMRPNCPLRRLPESGWAARHRNWCDARFGLSGRADGPISPDNQPQLRYRRTRSAFLFSFDNSYARLPQTFHRPARPAAARQPTLIRFNHALAEELGLDLGGVTDARLAQVLCGQVIPVGAEPLAQAYAGHQFGHFNPQLGDGRALLLGEVIDRAGRRRDIQLKGSGPTAFSRNGDGMAALGPVLREYIVSEAFAALGVPATRALAAVATGEQVIRETLLPGAVFTRVASSHIRVGTFQFFAAQGDEQAIQTLADHVIDRHYPEARQAESPYLAMLAMVAERQAKLIARWLSIGFIHGVMNTDNMAISGETIDFGPCAFLDEYDPRKVFSSIDQRGRYAYANQPGIGQWNIARFAECLLPLLDPDESKALEAANGVLQDFGDVFQAEWLALFAAKLGVTGERADDRPLVSDFWS